jgi:hypothetical protein
MWLREGWMRTQRGMKRNTHQLPAGQRSGALGKPAEFRTSVRTSVKENMTLLVKLRRSISSSMGVSFSRGMDLVCLTSKCRL